MLVFISHYPLRGKHSFESLSFRAIDSATANTLQRLCVPPYSHKFGARAGFSPARLSYSLLPLSIRLARHKGKLVIFLREFNSPLSLIACRIRLPATLHKGWQAWDFYPRVIQPLVLGLFYGGELPSDNFLSRTRRPCH